MLSYSERYMSLSTSGIHSNPCRQCSRMRFVFEIRFRSAIAKVCLNPNPISNPKPKLNPNPNPRLADLCDGGPPPEIHARDLHGDGNSKILCDLLYLYSVTLLVK